MEPKINEIMNNTVKAIFEKMLAEGDLLTPKGERVVKAYMGVPESEPAMTKVVINTCFGGFGLSYEAVKELMRRKGMECYAYSQRWDGQHFDDVYTRTDNGTLAFYFSKDLGDRLSEDEITAAFKTDAYFRCSDYDFNDSLRTDPDLVAVVEELGKKANGSAASLCVVEVPSNVDWYIHEYDGSEGIEENHRSWY